MQHLQSVQDIFQHKLFRIPDYQRGYAWEENQWLDLLEDLELLEDDQEHYTGTLVIHEAHDEGDINDDEGNTLKVYDVVDGQQRLTTLSILLHEISSQFRRIEGKRSFADGILKKYIATTKNDDTLPKLSLNRDTNVFYRNHIITSNKAVTSAKIASEQRLLDAKHYFSHYMAKKSEELGEHYLTWLNKTYNKISNKMKLTVYLVPKATDVGVIFEVMNNRGKKLTEMEKTKNYLLYLSSKLTCDGGKELGEDINRTWTYIYESLMSAEASDSDENQLLRSCWLMYHNYNAKQWDGSNSIKTVYNLKDYQGQHSQLRNDLRAYVNTLKECCTVYCDVIHAKRSGAFFGVKNEATRKALEEYTAKLLRIGVIASFIPLFMGIRLKHSGNLDIYLDLLKLCEKFTFRVYRYAGKRSNAGQSYLFKLGYDVYHGTVTHQDAFTGVHRLLLYYSPNKEFIEETNARGDWYGWYGLKYLLYEYELHLASDKPVLMDWVYLQKKDKQDSIEHILPQTPTQPYWQSRWSKEQIEEVTHDLGNLVITFDNSTYSNKGFDEKKGAAGKKGCYAGSSLFAERELASYDDWTYTEFETRRQKLADWIIVRWHVDDIGASLAVTDEETEDQDI